MQITQELCKRPGLNKAGFDMQTIFVPSLIDKVNIADPTVVYLVILAAIHLTHLLSFK